MTPIRYEKGKSRLLIQQHRHKSHRHFISIPVLKVLLNYRSDRLLKRLFVQREDDRLVYAVLLEKHTV